MCCAHVTKYSATHNSLCTRVCDLNKERSFSKDTKVGDARWVWHLAPARVYRQERSAFTPSSSSGRSRGARALSLSRQNRRASVRGSISLSLSKTCALLSTRAQEKGLCSRLDAAPRATSARRATAQSPRAVGRTRGARRRAGRPRPRAPPAPPPDARDFVSRAEGRTRERRQPVAS